MRQHILNDGVYVPEMGIRYPETTDQPMLFPKKVNDIKIDENYPYLDNSFKAKFFHYAIYAGIFLLVFPMQKLRYGLRIVGRKNLRKNKALLKNGAITICNHVYRWDFLAVLQAVRYRRLWFPARAENINSPDSLLIRSVGGVPIPGSFAAFKKFNEAFDTIRAKKKWLHVFPESYRWEWYQPIRPFKIGAFTMAVKYDIPVVPMVISYRKVTGWRKLFGIKHPLLTIHVGEPIVHDKNLRPKQAARQLLVQTHEQMCAMAGIKENCWPAEEITSAL